MTENNGNGNLPRRPMSKKEEAELASRERQEIERQQKKNAPPVPFEPRCHVCKSPYRNFVDALLVKGASYSSIADRVPGEEGKKLDRRSISRHAKEHLGYQEDALRKILEEEADFQRQNYEEGVRGAITHRGLMEVAIRKFYDDLLNGIITIEARDAFTAIQMLQKLNEETEAVAIDEMRSQVDALVTAIREETDPDTWQRISERAMRIYKSKELPQIESTATPV